MFVAALLVFFASGFAALVYQVIWQRLLTIFSGADVQSATLVVAAFMTGLGCGSLVGGHIADRVSRPVNLMLFVAAELAVCGFGFASDAFFYGFLYQRVVPLDLGPVPTSGILFMSLLWPTFFMGASLPLLARAMTQRITRAASTIGWLYAANTMGAAAGAFCASWWFLPRNGLDGSLRIAALINLGCAIAALAITASASRGARDSAENGSNSQASVPNPSASLPTAFPIAPNLTMCAVAFALSGFLALSFEIVWFRLLGVMLKSTTLTFGTLLTIYLFGLGAGAALGSAVAKRTRRPDAVFVGLVLGAGIWAALSVTLLAARLNQSPWLKWLPSPYSGAENIDVSAAVQGLQAVLASWIGGESPAAAWSSDFIKVYFVLPALLVGPATVLMGCSFPILQKLAQTDLDNVGRRVGILLAANIAGSTIGAFVTGWIFLDWLGTAGTLRLLVVLSGIVAAAAAWWWTGTAGRLRAFAYAALVVVAAGVAAVVPGSRSLWATLHGSELSGVIIAEDRSGLALLKVEKPSRSRGESFPRVVVFVNGLSQSWLPYGGIHTVLGALPAFIHPHPRQAAIIGLGSGDTLYAMAGRKEIEQIVSIEIIRPQLAALRELSQQYNYPGLLPIFDRTRVHHMFGDGRQFLSRSTRTFDIIEADALYPTAAYAGNLYSDAYFELLKQRLNPGGIAVSWAPTPRVFRTFLKVFPYTWHSGQVVMGSNDPIPMDRAAIMARLTDSSTDSYYRWAGVDIGQLLRPYIQGPWRRYGPDHDRASLVDINTDLYPKDEFAVP
jgi:predicted membrane-bound spermidine synthase